MTYWCFAQGELLTAAVYCPMASLVQVACAASMHVFLQSEQQGTTSLAKLVPRAQMRS